MSPVAVAAGLIGLQRLVELVIARRHTAILRARGAVELGARDYPWIVALHAAWLVSLPLIVPAQRMPDPWLIAAYLLLQPLRIWSMASLGVRWTTRLMVLPGVPPLRRGPYRWLRHPNYLIVTAEIALLPLAFGAWAHGLLFSALNALLRRRRIRLEDQAIEPARCDVSLQSGRH